MIIKKLTSQILLPLAALSVGAAQAVEVNVKIENLAPEGGVFFTPVWLGFHNGEFDSYDSGSPASMALERIAEDGDPSKLSALFMSQVSAGMDAVVTNPEGFAGAPVYEPGSVSNMVLDIDPATQRYLSYVSMIIPSNDAFVANGNPTEHQIFDENGDFSGPFSFTVYGSMVRDAGTEANTEMDAAFLNQSMGNSGETTADGVSDHPGFNGSIGNPNATPVNILGGTVASGDVIDVLAGDFTSMHYPIMRVTVSQTSFPVRVGIKNSSYENGTFLTPFWVAFHDGVFDTYDLGELASAGLERIAEDGDSSVLSQEFAAVAQGFDSVITNPEGFEGAPLFDPQMSSHQRFELNPEMNKYFSYAAMLLPSNDAFVANGNPKGIPLFDDNGNFQSAHVKIYGSDVLDAGTEDNTEMDAPFFNQSEGNSGVTTTDGVSQHPGFNGSVGNPDGSPQIFLDGTNPPGFYFDPEVADFTIEGSKVAEISISRWVDGSMSGTWFDPTHNGEGFVLDVTSDNETGEARAMVSWYTYNADGSGTQAWLFGVGPVLGDTVIVDMMRTEGAQFGPAFDSEDVIRIPWGQVVIRFNDCSLASLSYNALDSEFGSGSLSLQRLTQGPVDYKGSCQL